MLEHGRVDADLLGQLQQALLAGLALELVEEPAQLGVVVEEAFLGDDRQPEVDRDDEQAHRRVVLGDEVVERGHHAVAGPTLGLGVVERDVHAAARQQLLAIGSHAPPCVGLAELGGDLGRVVVQVAAAVRPADVVQDQQRESARSSRRRGVAEQPELVVDRVPVVVAVDERDVERTRRRAGRSG